MLLDKGDGNLELDIFALPINPTSLIRSFACDCGGGGGSMPMDNEEVRLLCRLLGRRCCNCEDVAEDEDLCC